MAARYEIETSFSLSRASWLPPVCCVCMYIDIEGTLKSIQPLSSSKDSHSASGGEEYTDLASDGELYLDTVDSLSSQEGFTQ